MADWRGLAKCKGFPTEVFFSERRSDVEVARMCCSGCPVRQPCREEARANGEYGTWGSETESERWQAGVRPAPRVDVLSARG